MLAGARLERLGGTFSSPRGTLSRICFGNEGSLYEPLIVLVVAALIAAPSHAGRAALHFRAHPMEGASVMLNLLSERLWPAFVGAIVAAIIVRFTLRVGPANARPSWSRLIDLGWYLMLPMAPLMAIGATLAHFGLDLWFMPHRLAMGHPFTVAVRLTVAYLPSLGLLSWFVTMSPSSEPTPRSDEARARRRDRRSGLGLVFALGLAAFVVVGRAIDIATGPVPPRRGAVAPSFSALDLGGAEKSLAEFRGQVVLLDFWATWCPPCVASMPELERTYQSLGDRGFVIVGINQEPESPDRVRGFVRAKGLSFPVVIDPGAIRRDFGVHSFPTSFLVDREGTICEVYRGPVSGEKLTKAVEALLEKPPGQPAC